MNSLVTIALVIFVSAWLLYLAGLRDKRVAFALWFPLTATSLFGTLVWLWALAGSLSAPSGGGAAVGFAALGFAIAAGAFLICPIVFAISWWQRPKAGAYGVAKTVPIVALYFGLMVGYRTFSENFDNQKLQLMVLDTKANPILHAKVKYETAQRSMGFSFPSSVMSGEVETQADGSVLLPVPKTHEIDIEVSRDGYAYLRIRMDRAWGDFPTRETWVSWQFPPDNPKKPWETHGGQAQMDVDAGELIHFTVYLPKTRAEAIPSYGTITIYSEKKGEAPKVEPSTIHLD